MKEFVQFVYRKKYDIIGICETKLHSKFTLKIPGYRTYSHPRNNRGGGVAIAIRRNIDHDKIFIDKLTNSFEHIEISIKTPTHSIIFCQIYLPPRKVLFTTDLKRLFENKNIIVMGDFNCKRKEWLCTADNTNGGILLDFCLKNRILICPPLTPTNFPTVGRPNVLDLFLTNATFEHNVPKSLNALNSDHNPVEMEFFCSYNKTEDVIMYDYQNANWNMFRSILNDKLNLNFHIASRESVEVKTNFFHSLVNTAAMGSIPTKVENFEYISYPDWIHALIRIKNRLRRRMQRRASPININFYRDFTSYVNSKIKQYQTIKIQKILKNLNINDGSIWKYTKKFTKKSFEIPNLTDNNNKVLISDKEKATALQPTSRLYPALVMI